MSIYEYDEELHMKTTREEGYEDGYATGMERGYNSGREDGYSSGKEDGYNSGKAAGMATGMQGAITALRNLDTPDTIIIENIVTVYQISEEEARGYMNRK